MITMRSRDHSLSSNSGFLQIPKKMDGFCPFWFQEFCMFVLGMAFIILNLWENQVLKGNAFRTSGACSLLSQIFGLREVIIN